VPGVSGRSIGANDGPPGGSSALCRPSSLRTCSHERLSALEAAASGQMAMLCTRRPLMFSFALEFIGPDTAQGREMTGLWQYERFRRIFRIITTVWGIGFLLEAALRVAIVYDTSTGTALASSTVTPFVWVAGLLAWTVAYGARQRKRGERLAGVREMAQASGAQPRPADLEER
jgi:hypothetical protein